jgi:hypothetical protein
MLADDVIGKEAVLAHGVALIGPLAVLGHGRIGRRGDLANAGRLAIAGLEPREVDDGIGRDRMVDDVFAVALIAVGVGQADDLAEQAPIEKTEGPDEIVGRKIRRDAALVRSAAENTILPALSVVNVHPGSPGKAV